MHQNCWAELEITPTNLDLITVISFRRERWSLEIKLNKIYLKALDHVHIEHPLDAREMQDEHESLLNGIIGHTRNLAYFTFGVSIKWGYESCNGDHQLSLYPSVQQQTATESSSMTFPSPQPKEDVAMLEALARSRRRGIHTLLNYSRRAQELDDLGYDAESFLNFYKVLECFYEIGKGSATHKLLIDRFTHAVGQKIIPKASLSKFSYNQIYFATAVFAGIGYDVRLRRANLIYLLRVISIRNGWNVGHKIFRTNPYDTYDAVGQHSDEFTHVIIENIHLETACRFFILKYAAPGKFKLDTSKGILTIVLA